MLALNSIKYVIYADAISLSIADKDLVNIQKNIQTELEYINQWVKQNHLKLDISKTY